MKSLSDKIVFAEDYAKEVNIGRLLHFEDVDEFIKKLINKRTFKILNCDENIDSIIISVKDLKKLAGNAFCVEDVE